VDAINKRARKDIRGQMTTFVLVTEHPPQLCQTSNAKCAGLYKKFAEIPRDTPGFKLLIGPLITSDHRSFSICEADDYEQVRKFTVASAVIQWNGVTVIPVINYDEALAELDDLEFIW
jgi:hypothetical protein